MPTLLQINSSVNTGSTGRIAEQLGECVISKGWTSYIAYGRRINSSKSEVIHIGSNWDTALHTLQTRLFDRHGLASVSSTKKFLDVVSRINPDIIHLHNIHGYYLNYPLLFAYIIRENIPVLWTLHDCWPFTGHCSYFSDIDCVRWKTVCHHCPKKKKYPASLIVDRSRENYRLKKQLFTLPNLTIITVSKWLGDIIRGSFLSKFPVHVIANGVDMNDFSPQSDIKEVRKKYRILNKYMLLGVAANWDSRKGLKDYFKLSSYLSEEYAIFLIGLSSKQKGSLPGNIIGIERTESIKELAMLYSAADIILNLSSLESFGMTTVEGFACGTPGIVYNCTASPELITNETGTIVEPGNIGQLVKAIETIRSKGKEYYSGHCRTRAEINYNNEKQLVDYLNIYNRLLTF